MPSASVETEEQRTWLADQIAGITDHVEVFVPSVWAEKRRYLPPSVTSLPGFYRFDVAPYLREIVDCLGVESPIREVAVMKGAQIGATVGVLENVIGYVIDNVKTAPVMLVTADAELAKLRMESYITPMLQFSGLEELIKSADEKNTRKKGKTDKKIEWVGGGYLIPFGAQNANKLRSFSIQFLLRDEVDGWPDVVGKDGDPMKLSEARTSGYRASRKILDISTPLIRGASKIERQFLRGDQRRYHVCCLKCGFPQELRWRVENPDTGVVAGMHWELKDGRLVPESVRYLCVKCGHGHVNDDKVRLLSPEHGAAWVPTAVPQLPEIRSYHISALYSPVGMQDWAACVQMWLEAWDVERNRPRDLGELQVFYNNVLGQTYELRGQKLRYEAVSAHKRDAYSFGEVPNRWAEQACASPVLVVMCTVDVHKESLSVATWGWCRDRRVILIDYWKFEGDCEQPDDAPTWGRLRTLIEGDGYTADDGKRYFIEMTLIDSGYLTDHVYQFCATFEGAAVCPVKGRDSSQATNSREFSEFVTPMGQRAYAISVDRYKDRWSAALRRDWNREGIQPVGFFNAPKDTHEKQLKELTVEVKREKIEQGTGKRIGFEWHRPSGAANELWDLLVYANAALDILAWDVCVRRFKLESVNMPAFYDFCLEQKMYFTD